MSKLNKLLECLDYRQYSDQSGYIGGLDPGKAYAVLPAKKFEEFLALMDERPAGNLLLDRGVVEDLKDSIKEASEALKKQPAPEWKVGDWFRCDGEQEITQVNEVIDEATLLATNRTFYKAEFCRRVPPPEDKPLQGKHWDQTEKNAARG